MKYIWIGILLGIEVTWLISVIVDIIHVIKYVKKFKPGASIAEVIYYIIDELKDSFEIFILLHIAILLIVSFATWLIGLTG